MELRKAVRAGQRGSALESSGLQPIHFLSPSLSETILQNSLPLHCHPSEQTRFPAFPWIANLRYSSTCRTRSLLTGWGQVCVCFVCLGYIYYIVETKCLKNIKACYFYMVGTIFSALARGNRIIWMPPPPKKKYEYKRVCECVCMGGGLLLLILQSVIFSIPTSDQLRLSVCVTVTISSHPHCCAPTSRLAPSSEPSLMFRAEFKVTFAAL